MGRAFRGRRMEGKVRGDGVVWVEAEVVLVLSPGFSSCRQEMRVGQNCGIKCSRRCTIAIQSFETSPLPVFNFASGLGHALKER